jgi:UDP-glucose 4-epimerase
VISLFTARMLAGLPTTIYGDGTQTRDFVFARDVAAAYVTACGRRADGLRVNIGTGVETPVRELHTELAQLCGAPDQPATGPGRLGELERSALDIARAREQLGWEPKIGLRAGLTETVEWMRGSVPGGPLQSDPGMSPQTDAVTG